jgi:cytidyltransferase-like protein
MNFNYSILGGTFDHLHAGHRYFIETALRESKNVTIGLVQKLFENKLFPNAIEDFETRFKKLQEWLDDRKYSEKVHILPINDIYGNSLSEKNIDAIFVTSHGLANARLINKTRVGNGLPALKICKAAFLKGNDGRIISSTRIRAGEIDREGFVFMSLFEKSLKLPESLRSETKNTPSGDLVKTDGDLKKALDGKFVIAVGDVVSGRLENLGRQAQVSIVDFKTRRAPLVSDNKTFHYSAHNGRGMISKNAVKVCKKAIGSFFKTGINQTVKIIGEEDLLALPSTLIAPLGSILVYGRPMEGAVVVDVTEEKKKEVRCIIEKLDRV